MRSGSGTLVLMDGSLPSLVAAAMAREGRLESVGGEVSAGASDGVRGPVAWLIGNSTMLRCAAAQAEALGMPIVARGEPSEEMSVERASGLVLLACAIAGARLGCGAVVWGAHCAAPGSETEVEIDRVAEGIDRATLIGRLASLEARAEVDVQTPFIDLCDLQIADLAIDMGVDPTSCWWAKGDGAAMAERRRWKAALRERGVVVMGQG
ncbi:MAG: hypothetical protein KF912_08775 [Phycisphaeraceae bacterium]|nr:hypothetical protein [Phycisphaeraceae bacterium]MBX3367390.1 hypothetical protein [Phycisphaeraceae bacterium]